ncbi:uncharacterized protein LOC121530013 [Drosophila eugracilis]|nr:uncharacterized protein LOC121530013 [Drosophila eugracilis]
MRNIGSFLSFVVIAMLAAALQPPRCPGGCQGWKQAG